MNPEVSSSEELEENDVGFLSVGGGGGWWEGDSPHGGVVIGIIISGGEFVFEVLKSFLFGRFEVVEVVGVFFEGGCTAGSGGGIH